MHYVFSCSNRVTIQSIHIYYYLFNDKVCVNASLMTKCRLVRVDFEFEMGERERGRKIGVEMR